MKLFTKIFIISATLAYITPLFSIAQSLNKNKQKESYLKVVDSIFNRSIKTTELKDSIALYAINFSIDIVKNNNGKTTVTKINVNDSLAYKLFPTYTRLRSLNYGSLLGSRKKLRLIIPVLIVNISDTAKKKYKKEDGSLLIDMHGAVNAAYALYSTLPFNNIKEAHIPLENRLYKSKGDTNELKLKTNVVYLIPYLIHILNIR
ncbi:hypothetical protein TH53_12535 [Pedobacter lusitanus]|uniref:Uncharacterized protein n=1 Tax=Pedobacter lusitanus TaxID=1503925 RepID=A0A0D0F5Q4_9SPHI|nr:hypothetical protein [Pedobacter lusitanus]KIO76913.1 hypothetical protein TH53_12535 [Pedobacter lusitanus]